MLQLFLIFYTDAPIVCLLFNLVRNSVVHSPSSAIRDPRYGNVSTFHPLPLLLLNDYAARYAVARYYLCLVYVDEYRLYLGPTADSV